MWILFGCISITLVLSNIGIIFFKNWGRIIHLILVGLFTIILVPFVLAFISAGYICTDDCEYMNTVPGGIASILVIVLLIAMCIGSIIYLTRPKVKALFIP